MSATGSDPGVKATAEALVQRYRLGVVRYVRALGAAADVAEDLAQEVFVVALQRGLRDDGGAGAFLRQTARYLFLRARRDLGRREELLVEHADRLWERHCAGDDGETWLAALRTCVGELGARPRAAVRLFYGEGRDRASAAAALGMKENGFKTLLQRVRARLRACIERRLGEQE